ncbi:MAG TPA: PEGA domain-containing protein [Kofleriaceae bacterium]|nr:PEGA domain-containing protein [Kofleriaceae bacterium]
MARALCLAACLAMMYGPAVAGPRAASGKTSKVTIETDPPGAKVYFGLKEDGEVCTTPCTVDAPIGETPIIVEAENRRSIIENLVVPRKTARPMKVAYKLEPAIGALVVEGAPGATVKIDDEDKGKAARIEGVLAGAHHVVVEKNGKPVYDGFVEVEAGHDATVSATGGGAAVAAVTPASEGEVPDALHGQAEPASRPHATPWFAVRGAMDVGFRQFTYQNNRSPANQRDNRESGQFLVGPVVEVWPAALAGLDFLRGLSLYGRVELGVNAQAVAVVGQNGQRAPSTLTTQWRSLEASVHQRWTIADVAGLEVGGGYAKDSYQFKGAITDIDIVPQAAYSTVRIGGKASLLLGMLEPYVAGEERVVLSGGAIGNRYKLGASANGVRGELGATIHLGHGVDAMVAGGYTRYSWTFKSDVGDAHQASGGTDAIENVTIAIGYVY